MSVIWEEPPAPTRTGGFAFTPKYAEFFAELRKNPGKWARWPGGECYSSVASSIRDGSYATTRPGEFTATSRSVRNADGKATGKYHVWVMYRGR